MFCGNCGTELPNDAQFCGNCGIRQGTMIIDTPHPQVESPMGAVNGNSNYGQWAPYPAVKKKNNALNIVLIIIAVVVAAVFMVNLFDSAGSYQYVWTDDQQSTPNAADNNVLRNTTWTSSEYGDYFGVAFYMAEETIDFGDGSYRYTLEGSLNGFLTSATETGTYTVSGETVIFTSNGDKTIMGESSGRQITGSLIGNSLTVGGTMYRR